MIVIRNLLRLALTILVLPFVLLSHILVTVGLFLFCSFTKDGRKIMKDIEEVLNKKEGENTAEVSNIAN